MEFERLRGTTNRIPVKLVDALLVLLLTVLAFAVMGYHPGLEDDGVYLSAVKADLNPSLYPHDSDFFRLQLQATVFDRSMAGFIRVTRIPAPWAELLWQIVSLYLVLWAAHRIAQKLFPEPRARWAGVALLAAMFTLPVAGTALNIADQHLHPRTVATVFILFAVDRILDGKIWPAAVLLLLALVMHPIMAVFGITFCFFLAITMTDRFSSWLLSVRGSRLAGGLVGAAIPMRWVFEPPTPAWHRALETRRYDFLCRWTWYEWLGAFGPLVVFWLLRQYALRRGETLLARLALGVFLYGVFQQTVAMILLTPPALIRFTPLQPMRYLHLVYVVLALIGGSLLGRHVLGGRLCRWALFLVAVNGGMFAAQRLMFPGSDHLELPGRAPRNPWLQAFAWIRQNTPADAYFAIDPDYLAAPGEDYHSFRALAERSQLADAIKDPSVVTQVPEVASRWAEQVDAQAGWSRFQLADFERLKERFGVGWVLVAYPPPARLTCIWHNNRLSVCQIPDLSRAPTF